MEKLDLNKEYDYFDAFRIHSLNRKELGNLPIHETFIEKYLTVLLYYPLSESKLKIYSTLNKKGKLGMLNRHILSVARKLNISQVIIKLASESTQSYKKCKKYMKNDTDNDTYWTERVQDYGRDIRQYYMIVIDMISEEITKISDVKYLRNKKLKKIINNNSISD
jgi:hypothetical protein